MRRLGTIVSKTKTGLIVVKSQLKDPRRIVGAIVYDKDMKRVGKIVDVMGPIDSPYVVVKPDSKEIADLIESGYLYYYIERRPRRRGRKAPRKSRRRR